MTERDCIEKCACRKSVNQRTVPLIDLDSEKLVKDITESLAGFCGETEQFDDITCAALVFRDNVKERRRLKVDIASFSVIRNTVLGPVRDRESS